MSILIKLPSLIKGGTFRTCPVSILAGLVEPAAVSPLLQGSHSVTLSLTKIGPTSREFYIPPPEDVKKLEASAKRRYLPSFKIAAFDSHRSQGPVTERELLEFFIGGSCQ